MSQARKYTLIVMLNALEDREQEFNDWFTNIHIPDAMKIPGFLSGQRFRLAAEQREGASRQWKYLTIYELETDNLQSVIDELKSRLGTPLMRATDTIVPGGFLHFFEPITEVLTRD